jgi:hypothetical protein
MTERHLSFEKESYFPRLERGKYRVTSDETAEYNCIAHAAGRSDFPWWPVEAVGVDWPEGVDREETLDCFIRAYGTQGYEVCESADLEPGFERIALYVDAYGETTHAARQLDNGHWTSKLGDWEDIEHKVLEALEDDVQGRGLGYGKVAVILKRSRL